MLNGLGDGGYHQHVAFGEFGPGNGAQFHQLLLTADEVDRAVVVPLANDLPRNRVNLREFAGNKVSHRGGAFRQTRSLVEQARGLKARAQVDINETSLKLLRDPLRAGKGRFAAVVIEKDAILCAR